MTQAPTPFVLSPKQYIHAIGLAGNTEQNTSYWVMTFMGILEEVDVATDIGPAMMWRWNSSEKEVSHVVSKVKMCQATPCCFLKTRLFAVQRQ